MIFPLLLSCAAVDPDDLLGVELREAMLYDVRLDTIALVGGRVTGVGRLVAVPRHEEGFYGAWTTMEGGTVGLDVELQASEDRSVVLELPDDETRGEHLLGTYRGRSSAATVLVGAETHHLKNKHDVELDAGSFGVGLGIGFAWEWVTVELSEPVTRYETPEDVEAWLEEEPP